MSDLGLICDVCGRTVHGMTFVHGMKFCAKCYQETFNNNVTKDIVDILNKEMYELQISNLKQQLAEKDKEISKLKNELLQPQSEMINSKEDVIDTIQSLNLFPNQKAIEELEKLKNTIYQDNLEDGYLDESVDIYSLAEYINKRIKELKGE